MPTDRAKNASLIRPEIECALPPHAHEHVDLDALFAAISEDENGHAMQAGWHFGWSWSADGCSLDFLNEHRFPGIEADTYSVDAEGNVTSTPIDLPSSLRVVLDDPEEDARAEAEHAAENRRRYARLRERGLLPGLGENVPSQDINELLISGEI